MIVKRFDKYDHQDADSMLSILVNKRPGDIFIVLLLKAVYTIAM